MKINFQVLDSDYVLVNNKPIVRLFGRTDKGKSTCVFYDDFEPYFYVLTKEGKVDELREYIKKNFSQYVVKMNNVKKFLPIGYQKKKTRVIKLTLNNPSKTPVVRDNLKEKKFVEQIFEADILFKYRFMADKNIFGMRWYEVEGSYAKTNSVKTMGKFRAKSFKEIDKDENMKFHYLSFDIETYFTGGSEPNPKKEPIILISMSFFPSYKNRNTMVLAAKKVKRYDDDIIGFNSEKEMLEEFVKIVDRFDPDIILGYNTNNFDLPYLDTRLKENNVPNTLGRCEQKSIRTSTFMGRTKVTIPGRVSADVYSLVKEAANKFGLFKGLKRYGLGDVSKNVLGEDKVDVAHSEIADYWNDNGDKLGKLLNYSRKDAELPLKILFKKSMLDKFVEISKVSGITLQDCLYRGETERIDSILLREFNKKDFIIPSRPDDREISRRKAERRKSGLKGAFVLEPDVGFHDNCTAYLDFHSMYPSIVISFNICPTTLLREKKDDIEYKETPFGSRFVTGDVRKGILPHVLDYLLDTRDKIKKEMKKAKKDSKKNYLYAKQYAFKTVANAFYGYSGYIRARFYVIDIASGITSVGRDMIKKTRDIVHKKTDYKVIYGDSVDYERNVVLKDKTGMVKVLKIGEFIDKFFDNKTKNQSKKITGWEALCYKGGKSVFRPVRRVIRHKYNPDKKGKLLKISTKWGETVVTPQHSVFLFNDGKPIPVDASKLKEGDLITVLNRIPDVEVNQKIDILDMIPEKIKKELFLYIPPRILPKDMINRVEKKHVRTRKHVYTIPISTLNGIGTELRNRKILEKCFIGGYGSYPFKGDSDFTIPTSIPLTQDFAYLLGMYVAEGHGENNLYKSGRKVGVHISNKDSRIIEKSRDIIKELFNRKINPVISDRRSNTQKLSLNGSTYYHLFKNILGTGKGASNKRIPPIILNAPRKIKKAFYRGYYEGDGNPNYKSTPRFDTISVGLRDDLTTLLKMLNERKTVSYHYRSSKDSWRVNYVNYSRNCECLTKRDIGGISVSKITKVDPTSEYVYDIEVEDAHSFVDAHGCVLLHNTDSVMIKLDTKDLEEAFKVGGELSETINEGINHVLHMKIESIFKALLLLAKKRYAAWNFEPMVDGWDESILTKGIETVRRDWCDLVSETLKEVLEIILKEQDVRKAVKFVKKTVDDLKSGKIPIEKLVITKSISRAPSRYKGVQPHVELVKKMMKRDPSSAPGVGDRVGYVIVRGVQMISKRAEDPDYIKEHNIPIDSKYYIESQLLPPLERVFEALRVSKSELTGIGKQLGILEAMKNNKQKNDFEEKLSEIDGFICNSCNNVYRRPPLTGKCNSCGGEIVFKNGSKKSRLFVPG